MKALKALSLIFLVLALFSWGVYFGIELLPVPYIEVTVKYKKPQVGEIIKEKFPQETLGVRKIKEYVYKDMDLYVVAWESENKDRLEKFKKAINAYIERRGLKFKVVVKPFGDKWILKVNKDFKNQEDAWKVQQQLYNRGEGYYLEVQPKKQISSIELYQITLIIPKDKLPILVDLVDNLKREYNDEFINLEVVRTIYKSSKEEEQGKK